MVASDENRGDWRFQFAAVVLIKRVHSAILDRASHASEVMLIADGLEKSRRRESTPKARKGRRRGGANLEISTDQQQVDLEPLTLLDVSNSIVHAIELTVAAAHDSNLLYKKNDLQIGAGEEEGANDTQVHTRRCSVCCLESVLADIRPRAWFEKA